jgi:hypothetical protein
MKALAIGIALLTAGIAYGSKDFIEQHNLYGARVPSQPFPWQDVRFVWTLVPGASRILIASSLPLLLGGLLWSISKGQARRVAKQR